MKFDDIVKLFFIEIVIKKIENFVKKGELDFLFMFFLLKVYVVLKEFIFMKEEVEYIFFISYFIKFELFYELFCWMFG